MMPSRLIYRLNLLESYPITGFSSAARAGGGGGDGSRWI